MTTADPRGTSPSAIAATRQQHRFIHPMWPWRQLSSGTQCVQPQALRLHATATMRTPHEGCLLDGQRPEMPRLPGDSSASMIDPVRASGSCRILYLDLAASLHAVTCASADSRRAYSEDSRSPAGSAWSNASLSRIISINEKVTL